MFSCDGFTCHLRQNLLTRAGNGIDWIQHWSHDRGKLQESKNKATSFGFLSTFMIHESTGLIRLGWRAGLTTTLPQSHPCRSPSVSEICTSAATLQLAQGLLRHSTLEYLPCKFTAYYFNYTVNELNMGARRPFSTLLILSFTLETSTLVLRGTLVLVRRIRNSGTLHTADRPAFRHVD